MFVDAVSCPRSELINIPTCLGNPDNRHVEVAACGGDACAVAISRLLAANVNSAVETPAFAESLGRIPRQRRRDTMKYWEIIADNLSKAGWSLAWVSALDLEGQTIWIVGAHRDGGKRFIIRTEEKLTACRT